MPSIPTIFVTEAVHYLDSSLSLDTVRYAIDPRPEGSEAITKAYASDAHEFVCRTCADHYGTRYHHVDATIREEWRNVAILTGFLGLFWTCDMCEQTIQGPDTDMDAYLYIHVMP